MRTLLMSAGLLAAIALPAAAQQNGGNQVVTGPPGWRSSEPLVHHPTNLNEQGAQSRISPALPQPRVGRYADVTDYLHSAHRALATHRLGLAQASLEQAETAALNQYVGRGRGFERSQTTRNIEHALRALAHRDVRSAMEIVERTIPMAARMSAEGYGPAQPNWRYSR